MSTTEAPLAESPTLQRFFDAIAFRYDFLNHLLSFKLDDSWRKRSLDLVLEERQSSVLDLGTGTGKFLELFLKTKSWKRAVGLDFAARMLEKAREAVPAAELVNGDFQALPFARESFDLVITAFTLRSIQNVRGFLEEVSRVLKKKGKAGFLCLTRPHNFFFKLLYTPYLKVYLPFMGGLVSGNRDAYRFLADSILNFQEPEKTASLMRDMGFCEVEIHRFTGGAATLICGRKAG